MLTNSRKIPSKTICPESNKDLNDTIELMNTSLESSVEVLSDQISNEVLSDFSKTLKRSSSQELPKSPKVKRTDCSTEESVKTNCLKQMETESCVKLGTESFKEGGYTNCNSTKDDGLESAAMGIKFSKEVEKYSVDREVESVSLQEVRIDNFEDVEANKTKKVGSESSTEVAVEMGTTSPKETETDYNGEVGTNNIKELEANPDKNFGINMTKGVETSSSKKDDIASSNEMDTNNVAEVGPDFSTKVMTYSTKEKTASTKEAKTKNIDEGEIVDTKAVDLESIENLAETVKVVETDCSSNLKKNCAMEMGILSDKEIMTDSAKITVMDYDEETGTDTGIKVETQFTNEVGRNSPTKLRTSSSLEIGINSQKQIGKHSLIVPETVSTEEVASSSQKVGLETSEDDETVPTKILVLVPPEEVRASSPVETTVFPGEENTISSKEFKTDNIKESDSESLKEAGTGDIEMDKEHSKEKKSESSQDMEKPFSNEIETKSSKVDNLFMDGMDSHQEKNFVELSVDNKGSEEILMTAKCTNEPVTVSVKESQLEKVDRILESLKTASPEEESNLLAELGVVTTFTKPKKVHYSEDSDCGLYSDGSEDLDEPDTTSNL